jgi:citrate lyase gamma subunit
MELAAVAEVAAGLTGATNSEVERQFGRQIKSAIAAVAPINRTFGGSFISLNIEPSRFAGRRDALAVGSA